MNKEQNPTIKSTQGNESNQATTQETLLSSNNTKQVNDNIGVMGSDVQEEANEANKDKLIKKGIFYSFGKAFGKIQVKKSVKWGFEKIQVKKAIKWSFTCIKNGTQNIFSRVPNPSRLPTWVRYLGAIMVLLAVPYMLCS